MLNRIATLLGLLLLVIVIIAGTGIPGALIYAAWNWILVPITGLAFLPFWWQAYVLGLILCILFKR